MRQESVSLLSRVKLKNYDKQHNGTEEVAQQPSPHPTGTASDMQKDIKDVRGWAQDERRVSVAKVCSGL